MNLLDAHRSALRQFDDRVRLVRDDQWDNATPDSEWTVRDLVAHLVTEQLWVPDLLAGRTVDEVGDVFDGDNLGVEPISAWETASSAARQAFSAPGALDRTVHLSSGDSPAADYCQEMTMDLVVHSWDLARAIRAEEELPNDVVGAALDHARKMIPHYQEAGIFAPSIDVPGCTDDLTELLALTGRRR